MNTKAKILLIILSFGFMSAFISCSNDPDENCPSQTFDTLAECEDATDGMKCICVPEGTNFKAILNP
jgi:hypothetical protein